MNWQTLKFELREHVAIVTLNQSFHLDQRAMAELESYAQGLCMDSDYHREAVRRFLAREPLAFPGLG